MNENETPYTREVLVNDLEENFADDPYGATTFVICNLVHRALNSGAINDRECSNLVSIEELLRELDNA